MLQKPEEKVEDYAADLKRLYEKLIQNEIQKQGTKTCYINVNMGSLTAMFNVKELENIDEAVLQCVSYEQTRRGQKNKNKTAKQIKREIKEDGKKGFNPNKKFVKGNNGRNNKSRQQTQEKTIIMELHAKLETMRQELEEIQRKQLSSKDRLYSRVIQP